MKHLLMTAITAAAISTAAPAQTADKSNWVVTNQTSALTGARTLAASLDSSNMLVNMLGRPAHASLVIRCGEGGLAFYVNWPQVVTFDGQNMAGQPKTMAFWRVGNAKIQGNLWSRDTTGTAAGEFQSKNAAKLITSLIGARTFAVRLTGQQTQDAQFDLGDADKLATDVLAACGVTVKR